MIISCAICGDIFTGVNPEESVYATVCGHLFHYNCLLEWFERSKTCPQCRHKTTEKNIVRVYFNNANVTSDNEDPTLLKYHVESLEYKLKLSEKEIKLLKAEKNAALHQTKGLRKEIKDMSSKVIVSEQKLLTTIDELKTLRCYCKQLSEVKMENEELKKEIASCKSINSIINGTIDEAKCALDNPDLSVEHLQQCCKYFKERIKNLESEHKNTEKEVLFYKRKVASQNNKLNDMQESLESLKGGQRSRENSFVLVSDDDGNNDVYNRATHKENVYSTVPAINESLEEKITSPSCKKMGFSKPKPSYRSKNTSLLGVTQTKSEFRIPKLSSYVSVIGDDEFHPTKYENAVKCPKRSKKQLSATDISTFKKVTSNNKKVTDFIEIL